METVQFLFFFFSIPQHILAKLEEQFGKHPSELFDVFAGTSAGSIVVAFMNMKDSQGKPVFTAKEAEEMSQTVSKIVFKQSKWRKFRGFGGLLGAKYSARPMEEALMSYMKDYRISDTLKPVVITAFDYNESEVFDFKTRYAASDPNRNFFLRDAVRSSTSAPTYFKPFELRFCDTGGKKRELALADGAVGSYSPEMDGILEAKSLYPGRKIIVISIGTGTPPKEGKAKTKGWQAGSIPQTLLRYISGNFDAQKQRATEAINSQKCSLNDAAGCIAQRLRIKYEVPKKISSLDNASDKNMRGLSKIAREITDMKKKSGFTNSSLKESNSQFKKIVSVLSQYHKPSKKVEKRPAAKKIAQKNLAGMCQVNIMASHSDKYRLYYTHKKRSLIGTGFKRLRNMPNLKKEGKRGGKLYTVSFDSPCKKPIRIRAKGAKSKYWTATVNFKEPKAEANLLTTVEGVYNLPKVRCATLKGAKCTDGITTK